MRISTPSWNVFYDQARRTWGLEGGATLGVRGGLGFSTDLTLIVTVAGFEVWREHWPLVNAQAGATWQGGLQVSSEGGVTFQPGGLEIGATSSATPEGTASISAAGGARRGSASGAPGAAGAAPRTPSGFNLGALAEAVLTEARSQITAAAGGAGSGGICRPAMFPTRQSAPMTPTGSWRAWRWKSGWRTPI